MPILFIIAVIIVIAFADTAEKWLDDLMDQIAEDHEEVMDRIDELEDLLVGGDELESPDKPRKGNVIDLKSPGEKK